MVIIMDNARFHKSIRTQELIENAGCRLLFLPSYSPDFNPIEHRWFPLKNTARKILQTLLCLTSAMEAAILCA
jgi:transposase